MTGEQMSYQYAISTSARPRLEPIATRLGVRGLLPVLSTQDKLTLSRAATPQRQAERWGGDVEICVEEDTVLVTINTNDHSEVLSDVLDELKQQGILTTVEEP